MDMTGEHTIAASRDDVWAALNDVDVLRACIPGCEELEQTSDTTMEAVVKQKIGPVKATFKGAVELQNIDAPKSYTIQGEGQGGVAGFAKGGANVTLEDVPEGTLLRYEAHAQVGGKLARLGSRLIDATAKKLAGKFFDNFQEHLNGPAEPEEG
ncbi:MULTISPECIES: CoxG family protein [Shimia]|uniref:CoxG family protein n=1 Tax=Shimia TaxID=573139 RepID=UPI001FB4E781|nr:MULTISPECIES: carbon monoxide dehydrogenase subunit G [Shimia]MDV4144987.1 carbon monoxide dehydrogenase subunit G [Shimia sp. FJ5]